MKRVFAWSLAAPCLLGLAGTLAACDARQWPLADYRSGHPAATSWRNPPSTSASATAPAARKPAASGVASSGTTTASTAILGPVAVSTDPSLIGLSMEQARTRLGPPHEEIEQAPAKVWRYRTTECSLDVALYPDVQTHVFRVLNYEVKGHDGTEQGQRKCIAGLRSGSLGR